MRQIIWKIVWIIILLPSSTKSSAQSTYEITHWKMNFFKRMKKQKDYTIEKRDTLNRIISEEAYHKNKLLHTTAYIYGNNFIRKVEYSNKWKDAVRVHYKAFDDKGNMTMEIH